METCLIVGASKPSRKLVFSLTAETKRPLREKYVGLVISQKHIKNMDINNGLKVAWAKYKSLSIIDLKENLIIIEFEVEEEKAAILDQMSWSIQGH